MKFATFYESRSFIVVGERYMHTILFKRFHDTAVHIIASPALISRATLRLCFHL